jgi:hypothetical protein
MTQPAFVTSSPLSPILATDTRVPASALVAEQPLAATAPATQKNGFLGRFNPHIGRHVNNLERDIGLPATQNASNINTPKPSLFSRAAMMLKKPFGAKNTSNSNKSGYAPTPNSGLAGQTRFGNASNAISSKR